LTGVPEISQENKERRHEMRVVFTNGHALPMTLREMYRAVLAPLTLGLMAIGVLLFWAITPQSEPLRLPPRLAAVFVGVMPGLFLICYLGFAAICARQNRTMLTPVVLGLTAGILSLTGTAVLLAAGEIVLDLQAIAVFWLYLWMFLLVFDILFASLVLPRVHAAPQPIDGRPDRNRDAFLWFFVNGRSDRASLADFAAILQHPLTAGSTLLAVLFLVVFHPYLGLGALPVHLATLFWAQSLLVFYLTLFGVALLCRMLGLILVMPVAMALVALAVTHFANQFLYWTTGILAERTDFLTFWMFHWAVMVLVEYLLVTFAYDRLRQDVRSRTAERKSRLARVPAADSIPDKPPRDATFAPQPAPGGGTTWAAPTPSDTFQPRQADPDPARRATLSHPETASGLVLQGTVVPVGLLEHIAAEEHYVRVVTTERTRFFRGRLGDVETQLPARIGLRVHRSHWVAGRAVAGLRRDLSGWVVVLESGTEVPVARSRQAVVRRWVEAVLAARPS